MSSIPIDDDIVLRGDNRFLPENEDPSVDVEKAYKEDDPTGADIDNADYFPFYDTSATAKKKTLWSTIVDKIKSALGIASSGTTFLRKDGSWATPANTTYTFATGDSNGQIKVTPSGGSAQNVSVKGLGSAAYETADTAATANTVVKRNSSGYIYGTFLNGSNAAQDPASFTSYAAFQDSNGWFRKSTKANFQTWLNCLLKTGGTLTGNLTVNRSDGTTSAAGQSQLALGNSTASGTEGNSYGRLYLYSTNTSGVGLRAASTTSSSNLYLPAGRDGQTLATTAQIPSQFDMQEAARIWWESQPYLELINSKVSKGGDTISGNLTVNRGDGTTSSVGSSSITLGNSTASGTNKNSYGQVVIYSQQSAGVRLRAQDLTSARNLYLPASGTALATSASSSARVKENIRDMTEEEARKILDIDVVKFDYKEEYEDGLLDQSGVIAEEVLDIIPEVVSIHPMYDETKAIDPASNPSPTVDYGKFAPYLIKMIQMQQQKIEELEQRLAALEI